MRTQDICALPVAEIADEDCALFIWATMPKLKDAFAVIDAWGFKFKTAAFVWIKLNPNSDRLFWGMGAWTRSNSLPEGLPPAGMYGVMKFHAMCFYNASHGGIYF